jgi:hypothetical protein
MSVFPNENAAARSLGDTQQQPNVLEAGDDDYASCVEITHCFKDIIDASKIDFLRDDLGRSQYSSLTHGEHGSEPLALHAKTSKEPQFVEKNDVNRKWNIAFFLPGRVTELDVAA